MRTIEDGVVVESRVAQIARDLRVFRRLKRHVGGYFVSGALVRRRYRQKQRRGGMFFVDEEFGQ